MILRCTAKLATALRTGPLAPGVQNPNPAKLKRVVRKHRTYERRSPRSADRGPDAACGHLTRGSRDPFGERFAQASRASARMPSHCLVKSCARWSKAQAQRGSPRQSTDDSSERSTSSASRSVRGGRAPRLAATERHRRARRRSRALRSPHAWHLPRPSGDRASLARSTDGGAKS